MKAPDATKNLSARVVAVRVLERVERDGAFAAAALDAELDRHPQLDVRDRGLSSELVYGVLRTRRALGERLLAHAPRGIADALVRLHLEVAAYQILLLDRIPAFAAVDEAIGDLKRARGPRVAGFGNAVLRKLALEPKLDPVAAVRTSAPAWLVAKLEAAVGAREAEALLGAGVASGRLWA
ncbi:MAG TPA: transcription antitermination factor NusB, partial [Polyangiaceae bacterium]|nr:transcription antitermination factor NusB [Polyangiaceae bacterium]